MTDTTTIHTTNGGDDLGSALDALIQQARVEAIEQAMQDHTCTADRTETLYGLKQRVFDALPENLRPACKVEHAINEDGDLVLTLKGVTADDAEAAHLVANGFTFDPEQIVDVEYEAEDVSVRGFYITADQIDSILGDLDDYVRDAAMEELTYAEFPINIDSVDRAETMDDVEVTVDTDVRGSAEFTVEYLLGGVDEFADEDEFLSALREGARIAISQEFGIADHKVTIVDLDRS